ncbi:hypothetical protein GCM10010116_24600 [Microbispora rosea subsp. aerata]|nr:hypothetical protein [Microbispora rosea]GGO12258.1 hypothetical protein GCM10010116_24600 [Microbispora rosea subsp. aerata]GIH58619.1 hypothetical protein Mro02_55330 [Microbispora rosea subsp. aerata]GLJ84699.1 hypothetical protein GCM10017588_34270 [Microbispora rosea subsp. aerata]
MLPYDDLMRLAHEHQDLAEAIEEVLKPIGPSIDRMQWKGPHRDRVRTEVGTMTQNAHKVAEALRNRAKLIASAAVLAPGSLLSAGLTPILADLGGALVGAVGQPGKENSADPLLQLRTLHQQLTPMGSKVAAFFAQHGIR